jgi:hypothetical protein
MRAVYIIRALWRRQRAFFRARARAFSFFLFSSFLRFTEFSRRAVTHGSLWPQTRAHARALILLDAFAFGCKPMGQVDYSSLPRDL